MLLGLSLYLVQTIHNAMCKGKYAAISRQDQAQEHGERIRLRFAVYQVRSRSFCHALFRNFEIGWSFLELFRFGCVGHWLIVKRSSTHGTKARKQDAAREPECTHVEHFCETNYLNSLVHCSPVAATVHCGLWNAEEGAVRSVQYAESVRAKAWRVWHGDCEVWSVECKVWVESVKCRVWRAKRKV